MSTERTSPPPEVSRARSWVGRQVTDRNGESLGMLEHVYLARETNQPTWGVVRTGRRGNERRFVPLGEATGDGDVTVRADRDRVMTAPQVPADEELDPNTESQLRSHYTEASTPSAGSSGRGTATGAAAGGAAAGGTAGATAAQTGGRHAGQQQSDEKQSAMGMPRSRGLMSAMLLIPLGIWGALIPLVGPYFNYAYSPDVPWYVTWDRLWLCILPGAAVFLGGMMLGPAANRASGLLGAWLALAGGIWFVTGPSISMLWGNAGPGAPIGEPLGPTIVQVIEQLGFFYGLGAVITTLAAMAAGRLTVRSPRDPAK